MLPKRSKVLVAMSGGVDSSVAAALLKLQGHEVVGCFMRLGSPGEALDEPSLDSSCDASRVRIGRQGCCSINDAADARQVAARLDIPLYVCNFKREFGRVIEYFVDEYAAGRTPNPCVRCNDWLKFGKLHEYAHQLGAEFVASGHYAAIGRGADGRATLRRAADDAKDQSYVLFGIPRERLGATLFPLGSMRKPEVRARARELGLAVFDKPDSQEICFVPDNDYAGLVERVRPELARPGEIRDEHGAVVGTHGGQHRFTIGQRRGVGVAFGRPVYVVEKDAGQNTVRLGSRADLLASGCVARDINWLVDRAAEGEAFACLARVRSNATAVPARARRAGESLEIEFDEPQSAIAPGQAVVLYGREDPGLVIAGGWISSRSSTSSA